MVHETILDAVGRTPLVRLGKIVPKGSATILVKCEFMNPTGSIKDRMAVHILRESEKSGALRPGMTIVENTSGNTGLGVAMFAAVRGYRCIFTMPDKMSQEKRDMLRAFGAEVVITPTDVPGDDPRHYVETAKRIARERSGFYVNQYHNPLNIDAHEHSTAPEIWEQTGGRLDAVVAGAGTGGTISGIGRYFKKNHPSVRIVGVDVVGSIHYDYFYTKKLVPAEVYKVEGIGEDILCEAMDYSVVDEFIRVDDAQSFGAARRLVREEGLFCGGSSGSNVHAALEVARKLGPGKVVVTVLPDSATRYTTKFLNDTWMKENGFLARDATTVGELVRRRGAPTLSAREDDTIASIIALMRKHGVSQVPIVDDAGRPRSIVHEIDLLRALQNGRFTPASPAREAAHPIVGMLQHNARIDELFPIFETDRVGIVVEGERLIGVVGQIDLIEHLTRAGRA